MRTKKPWLSLLALLAALSLIAAACGDDSDDSSSTDTTEESTESTAAEGEGEGEEEAPAEEPGTIVDVASGNDDFSTLVTAVTAADPAVAEALSGEGPLTVFAPVNDAFAAIPEEDLNALLEDPEALSNILTYHVVEGAVLSSDLTDGQVVTTVQGEDLTIGVTDEGVTVTDASGNTVNVVTADVEASNGVIHAIDGVLTPAG